jgi:copper(I)-binding protein
MLLLPSAALAASLAVASSAAAFADDGVIAAGCAYGQTFIAGSITVTGAFIPAVPKGAPTAAAYMQIKSAGDTDMLTGATSAAGELSLHRMKTDGSVMQMAPVAGGLPVPAGGSVSFDPMGYHLMLTGMTQPFTEGQCVEMTLHFARAGDLLIELNVGAIGSRVAPTAPPAGRSSGTEPAPGMSSMDMPGMSSMAM